MQQISDKVIAKQSIFVYDYFKIVLLFGTEIHSLVKYLSTSKNNHYCTILSDCICISNSSVCSAKHNHNAVGGGVNIVRN